MRLEENFLTLAYVFINIHYQEVSGFKSNFIVMI